MMLGSSYLLIGLLDFLPWRRLSLSIFILLTTASIGWQFQQANLYREDWIKFRTLFWQLTARAPGLVPGTMVTAYELPIDHYSDNSLTAALNWIYAPEFIGGDLPYAMNYVSVRRESVYQNISADPDFDQPFLTYQFKGKMSNSVTLNQPVDGCLQILSKEYNQSDLFSQARNTMTRLADFSNLDRILLSSVKFGDLIPDILPALETENWCLTYEQADAERQKSNWDSIVLAWVKAENSGLSYRDPAELFPFIEAFGVKADFPQAIKLTTIVYTLKPSYKQSLCSVWSRIISTTTGEVIPEIHSLLDRITCNP
jgi:hypothetical protein